MGSINGGATKCFPTYFPSGVVDVAVIGEMLYHRSQVLRSAAGRHWAVSR